MKEELERLYKVEYELNQQLEKLKKQLDIAKITLHNLQHDKWARTQIMKYCECTVGQLVDECFIEINKVI